MSLKDSKANNAYEGKFKMTLVERWAKAIREIGGAPVLLSLPEEVKNVLKNTTDLAVKVEMLELISRERKTR